MYLADIQENYYHLADPFAADVKEHHKPASVWRAPEKKKGKRAEIVTFVLKNPGSGVSWDAGQSRSLAAVCYQEFD